MRIVEGRMAQVAPGWSYSPAVWLSSSRQRNGALTLDFVPSDYGSGG